MTLAPHDKLNPLSGLVLCGGSATRMGRDKGTLLYHGRPQREYLYDQLAELCGQAFISCRADQQGGIGPSYKVIMDQYENIGPIAGLLSAFGSFPRQSFLVVACDYPFLTLSDMQLLVAARDERSMAVCYRHPGSGMSEPLIAVYEQSCAEALSAYYLSGKTSLREFLESIACNALSPRNEDVLTSIDTYEGYEKVLSSLK